MLEEGLAYIYLPSNARKPEQFNEYKTAEESAKSKKIGIWGNSLKLMSTGTDEKNREGNLVGKGAKFEINQRVKVEMSDMTDARSFWMMRRLINGFLLRELKHQQHSSKKIGNMTLHINGKTLWRLLRNK